MSQLKRQSTAWRFYDSLNFYRGFAIIYAVGLVGHLVSATRPLMLWLTPFVLALSAGIVAVPFFRKRNTRVILWFGITGTMTFAAEAIGVASGFPFGSYRYTDALGPAMFDVPVIIVFNWMVVILGALGAAGMVFKNRVLIVLGASALTVGFDLVLEPTAIGLDYWRWENNTVPSQNYLAWGGLSLINGILYMALKCRHSESLPAYFFVLMLLYFALLLVGIE